MRSMNKHQGMMGTVNITIRILARAIGTSGDVGQNPVLAKAVTMLIFIGAVDGCDRCRIAFFLLRSFLS